VAKILGLSVYQIYKWGYDRRKNKKNVSKFVNIEIDHQILERINKIEQEHKHSPQFDLNQQVEDLLGCTTDYK
jgi:hypothetical protein